MGDAGPGQGGAQLPFPGDAHAELILLQKYGGLNTKADRAAISDEQFSWLENYLVLGDGNMRTAWAEASSPLYTTGGAAIIQIIPFSIGVIQYMAVFLADGTAFQVRLSNGAVVTISATPGKFFSGTNLPQIAQWGQSGILIVAPDIANGYFAWDEAAGGTLYNPGSPSPSWLKSGGTMPMGITGTGIEIFQSRVWICNGGNVFFSAPSDGTTFSGAGGVFPSTDSFLRAQFTNLKQANGFLYLFGDSSVNVISNVQTNAGTTTFTNQNVDPQVGTPFFGSVVPFGRGLMFASSAGVFAMYGGDAQKVSNELDGIFATANFTTTPTPTAGVVILFGVRYYALLVNLIDGYTGAQVRKICAWDGRKWHILSQLHSFIIIAGSEINSIMSLWGTDGISIWNLFQTPSTALNKIMRTKLWSGKYNFIVVKQAIRLFMMINNLAGGQVVLNGNMETETAQNAFTFNTATAFSGGIINFLNNSGQLIQFQNVGFSNIFFVKSSRAILGINAEAAGSIMGFTLVNTAADMQMLGFALGYQDLGPIG
jgi:hypothetical protein